MRITFNVTKCTAINFERAGRSFIQPRPVTVFGEPVKWVDTTRYLEVTTDIRLNWSPHIDHVRKRAARRRGMLCLFLNRKSDLSVRNGVLRYKQLTRPMIYDVCPAWRSAACIRVRRLQVLQSKYLRLTIRAPWYVRNRHIHEDLGVSKFADHITGLTESFDSKLAYVATPYYGNSADT